MRQQLICAALLLSTAAYADDKPKPDKPIATKDVVDKLAVFKDDTGNFYVTPKPGAFADSDAGNQWVFFGDAKGVFQQSIVGFSMNGAELSWNLWSPRAKNMTTGELTIDKSGVSISCSYRDSKYDKRNLVVLSDDQARAFIQKTPFLPRLWKRQAHFLARDDEGNYFYVDRLQDEFGGKGYRVFSGLKGQMKELAMTNIVSDSAGEIFATKGGDLRVVTENPRVAEEQGKADSKAYWKKAGTRSDLVVLPLYPNKYLIYRELGIYGRLGVVCDDN